MMDIGTYARTGVSMKEKYKEPQHFMEPKDPKLPAEQMLDIDVAQLKAAKDAELLKSLRVRFIDHGPDRTIDQFTKYPRTVTVEGFSAQQTILELRQQLADLEDVALEEINLFGQNTTLSDKMTVADCYVDWMGFGLEDWPPRLISKPKVRGFEVFVDVPASRDTSVWENGRMLSYFDRQLIFDVDPDTKVDDLKGLIAKKTTVPAKRQKLAAYVRDTLASPGHFVVLEDGHKSLADYGLEKYCVAIKFGKHPFDENGDYVFDDAYWDFEGYHPQPRDTWLPQDSLCDRSRPDAHKVDPAQPLSIVSDRRAKEAAAA